MDIEIRVNGKVLGLSGRVWSIPAMIAAALVGMMIVPVVGWAESAVDEYGFYEFEAGDPISAGEVNVNFDLLRDFKKRFEGAITVEEETGEIGLGIDVPREHLHLKRPGATYARFESDDASISVGVGGGSPLMSWEGADPGSQWIFMVNGEEAMTIDNNRNIAIGTSVTPKSALHITDGYLQINSIPGAPPAADCDEVEERGRMIWDRDQNALWICDDSGPAWIVVGG